MQSKRFTFAAMLAAVVASGAAQAQDWTFKIGATRYDAHSRTSGIVGIGVPPGADAVVGDANTVIFVVERALTPNVGVEAVIGIPPRIKARATGSVAFLGDDVLSAKNVAPTFFLTYHFGSAADTLRPYIGAGFNYTMFRSARSSLAPQVTLTDSFGLAVHAGIDYALTRNIGLWASVSRIDVKSDLVAVASTVLTTSIDFRPYTYSAGVRYTF